MSLSVVSRYGRDDNYRTSVNKSAREEILGWSDTGQRLTLYVHVVKDPLSFPYPFSFIPRYHPLPSSAVISRLPAAGSRGRYPILIRGELSGRFKLYDPAIKIVLTDNYI